MAADEKWYFTKQQLANSPSRRCGLDADKELSYRQQAANFIQDMGQRLKVTQLCINTAIVYMHRFYVFHSFTQFHRNSMAAASLFLAAKVEEQPRKLEHVITVAHLCLYREEPKLDTKSEQYLEQAQELVFNENVLLQTLGFDVAIDHPHTHVVRCCQLVRANKELAQTSYFMASNSLHLTTMCLQYKPTVVACFCIHLACKWSNWEIPQSSEGKNWYNYVDPSVSLEQLEQLTAEFLLIFDKCPSRLKKMSGKKDDSYGFMAHNLSGMQMDQEPRKGRPIFAGQVRQNPQGQSQDSSTSSSSQQQGRPGAPDDKKPHHAPPRVDYREYKEKKAREAAAAAAAAAATGGVVSKDTKPPQPPHAQHARQQPPSHHLAKRDLVKREMMARENAKREAIKQDAARRDLSNLQQRPMDVPNPHHSSQDSRDQKRPRDVTDLAIAGSSGSQHHPDAASLLQKRPDNHHLFSDPSRRSREPSDLPTSVTSHHHHHHHPDQSRRDKERPESSSSNHHNHPSMNQLKRPRDGSDIAPSAHQITQPKRPREGTDPMMNTLDSTKRPREPTDSSSIFNSIKTEPNSQPSSSEQHSERQHMQDTKHLGAISKYPSDIKSQTPGSHSTFNDIRQSKSMAPTSASSSQRHFNHSSRHSRPPEASGMPKNYEQDQRKLAMDKRDSPVFPKPQQDSHSLRPNQPVLGKSPIPPFSRSKSPLEIPRVTEMRPRSPLLAGNVELDKKSTSTPEVNRRMADILSRPEGHLFSPDDDREDTSISLDVTLPDLMPTKFETKTPKQSTVMKSKLRTTPEKSREGLVAPSTFALPSSLTSPATPGKSHLPTTPTTPSSERKRKRTQSSSSSEAELIPVVRKLDDIPGYQTMIKDGNMGIKLSGRTSDHSLPSTPGKDNPSPLTVKHDPIDIKPLMPDFTKVESKEVRHSFASLAADSLAMELKSEPIVSDTSIVSQTIPSIFEPLPTLERNVETQKIIEEAPPSSEHHRKKKKEKHGKKDKDGDRNREEKKHKHKKKDREKAREERNAEKNSGQTPIKLTIHKGSFSQDNKNSPISQDTTLKIKIPKERLKGESPPIASSSSTASSVALGGLKIKIGREVISERRLESSPSEQTSSRKQRANETAPSRGAPNASASRRNYNKQNGHQDRKVRGGYTRGRGRAPPMHQPPLPTHPPPHYPHQYYPYPPPSHMYMYPPDPQHMYGFYPPQVPQPTMYQQYPPPPLPMGTDFQNPPPPPLPEGPPPVAPPPPPPPE